MRHFVTIIILILSVADMSAARPLRGRLVDFRNKPITSAKIYVHDLDNYVKPDKQGRFRVEGVNPDDTIYVKWRGRFYGIPVERSRGVTVKFDREPNNTPVVSLGLFGTMHSNNHNGPVQHIIPYSTVVEIMRQESLKYYDSEEDLLAEAELTTEPFRGRLFDYKNKPIKNAKVYARGSNRFVKTDGQGKFLLYGVHSSDTVFVSWKGDIYDIPVEGNNGAVIKFGKDQPKRLDLVDTGAGLMDARQYNGPRAVRTAQELEAMGTSNLAYAMQGMKGVTVSSPKKAGDPPIVRVRGSEPLWILDGVRQTEMPDLSVMEIERIEVLHDGGMYGIGAMGGVINITTKGTNF